MPTDKPHRIRVKVLDGKPRDRNKLKGKLLPYVDVIDVGGGVEFIIAAVKETHLVQVRAKLAAVGLEEISGGQTDLPTPTPKTANVQDILPQTPAPQTRVQRGLEQQNSLSLEPKPYGFVPLPAELTTAPPVWHDGTGAFGRLSGEINCEIETLSPLLVGWERRAIKDVAEPFPAPHARANIAEHDDLLWRVAEAARQDQREQAEYYNELRDSIVDVGIDGVGLTVETKSLLYPLRAPWGDRPVLLQGDSIKGLLRHELGALLGAPMERVAERSYSYRPNLTYPNDSAGRVLEPRLARVKKMNPNSNTLDGQAYNFPEELDILYMAIGRQDYYPRRVTDRATNEKYTEYPPPGSEPYKGGMGGGERMPPSVLSAAARGRIIHTRIGVGALGVEHAGKPVCDEVRDQYFRTLKHLLDSETGHFSARHPNVGKEQKIGKAGVDAIRQAAGKVFQDGDLIWVEWDKQQERIVSLGWHYYYRWAYVDTVRLKDWREGRPGLFPLPDETTPDRTGAPIGLSPVRRLFGYTGDNKGSAGIGEGDHSQLMGRLSINTAIEVVNPGEADEIRFLPPIFLKELGQPRPSAVEHYLQQPHQPNRRPSDRARLASYGDAVGGAAAGYDEPGKLAGRKFYLDREGACASTPWNNAPWDDPRWGAAPWADFSETNRLNDRSTLALQASRPGRTFRFTVRFRDLDPSELAAVLAALCPNQFSEALGGAATGDYCSKLGYARPLGWGSVRIEAKKLLLLNTSREKPTLDPDDVYGRVEKFAETWPGLADWLAIHRRDHLEAGDYPTKNGQIYLYHTTLRGDHALDRRYDLKRRQNQPRS